MKFMKRSNSLLYLFNPSFVEKPNNKDNSKNSDQTYKQKAPSFK